MGVLGGDLRELETSWESEGVQSDESLPVVCLRQLAVAKYFDLFHVSVLLLRNVWWCQSLFQGKVRTELGLKSIFKSDWWQEVARLVLRLNLHV